MQPLRVDIVQIPHECAQQLLSRSLAKLSSLAIDLDDFPSQVGNQDGIDAVFKKLLVTPVSRLERLRDLRAFASAVAQLL